MASREQARQAQRLAHRPRLERAAARRVRRVAVGDLRQMPEPRVVEMREQGVEEARARLGARRRRAAPDAQQAQVRIQLASVLRAVVTQRLLPAKEPGKRVPAVEVLRASYAIAAQIRESKTHQLATQIQLGQDEGMIPLERSLVDLVRTGRITRETALAAARSPEELQRWLKD